ncbi:MAG: Heat-inducible transcription repressor hrcA [Candidatus Gottesmanbacteria bacterium GW2011_GWA1_42_26]|nr:MAG: Heat-inducible transcription repressor hrcA [Candidatus Gottesmanbacteria bacterium GW2011_GWA1_42_26]
MVELTDRQIKLLKAVIEEYIETAEPVGSQTLDKKYNLGVSPATIRNEMVALTKNGFLKQPHTSAGRVPTPMALKFYIQNLMQQKEMSVTDEVSVKQKIWDYRQKTDKLLREATKALADKTHTLAISTTNTGDVYFAGMANLLDMLEFYDMIATKNLLLILDESDFWWSIFGKDVGEAPFHVIFGDDNRVCDWDRRTSPAQFSLCDSHSFLFWAFDWGYRGRMVSTLKYQGYQKYHEYQEFFV